MQTEEAPESLNSPRKIQVYGDEIQPRRNKSFCTNRKTIFDAISREKRDQLFVNIHIYTYIYIYIHRTINLGQGVPQ